MSGMHERFRRRYAGRGPWEEVWFLEATAGKGRGVWLRYVITDGAHAEASLWAVAFDGARVVAHHEPFPLAELGASDVFDRRDHEAQLTPTRAVGAAGPIRWDLALEDRGRTHALIPARIERLRLGRHYVPAIADLVVRGTVEVEGDTWQIDGGRGVLGHIHGGRNRTRGWTWAHCNTFSGSEALFEGLSARLGQGPVVTPPLTSLVLHHEGRCYAFDRVRDLVSVRSRFGDGRWSFGARRGALSLEGEAFLSPRHATLRYTDPDGIPSWCTNSRRAQLTIQLRDRESDVDAELRSGAAAFEIGTREAPSAPIDAG